MSTARGVGTLTIRRGSPAGEVERTLLQAMRRHLTGRPGLGPAEREAAAVAAARAVLARLQRGERGR